MSDSDEERTNVGGGDGVDDEGGGGAVVPRDDRKKQRGHECGRDLRKAKQVVLFPFRNAKKRLYARNNNNNNKRSPAAAASAIGRSCSSSGKRRMIGCNLCFTQPPTSESPIHSPTSDPNNPHFTYECLKALIEKNDFYSKECNPHI